MTRIAIVVMLTVALGALAGSAQAQDAPAGARPGARRVTVVQTDKFRTQYIRIGNQAEGLLYEPTIVKPHVAVVYTHPDRDNFDDPIARELADRGYRAMMVNYRGDPEFREADPESYLPSLSQAIAFMRTLPGVERVVLMGHSGGGHLVALYGAVAEHGPSACQGPEKIYPCNPEGLTGLAKPDGLILVDSTLGAFHQMSAIVDPALTDKGVDASLDMFSPANGFDPAAKSATYSAAFAKRFYAAQGAGNDKMIDNALARLKLIEQGKGRYSDDEPLVIGGMGERSSGARLYQTDTAIVSHTKKPHLLLRADGTDAQVVVQSVRPPTGRSGGGAQSSMNTLIQDTTVRRFLAAWAIRTGLDYAITADDIVGVDWRSAYNSTPAMAEDISAPTLVLTMSCHYLIVPGEIMFDHLAAKDKTYASVEGASHTFTPCKAQYGDTVKRTFDFVDDWLSKSDRF